MVDSSLERALNHEESAMLRITLRNTPDRKGVAVRPARFVSNGNALKGTLYAPETAAAPLPAASDAVAGFLKS